MSLNKAIEHGKEHRKPYRGSKAIDSTCRNHGSCEWCEGNRLYQRIKAEEASDEALQEYEEIIMEKVITQITENDVLALMNALNETQGEEISVEFTPKAFPDYRLKVTLYKNEIEEEEVDVEDE